MSRPRRSVTIVVQYQMLNGNQAEEAAERIARMIQRKILSGGGLALEELK